MWGPSAIFHIVNIIPFATFLGLNFISNRGNILGINPTGNSITYYRRLWVRVFFGKMNIYFYALGGIFYLSYKYSQRRNQENLYYSFTSYLNDVEKYDDEVSHIAHKQLVDHMYYKQISNKRESVLLHRAQVSHDLKIEAFNEYAMHNNM